ncbi:hypothetical protein ID866_3350 [Astraeus odoratus]|nr:hypothetical protein ID866_3350 [Astraeus odoratus]
MCFSVHLPASYGREESKRAPRRTYEVLASRRHKT